MGHKRILGKLKDYITDREITDTDDERYRQKLAHMLVEDKGYNKEDIDVRRKITMMIDDKSVLSMVDFVIRIAGKSMVIIKYGPGSLVTRERPALAIARILESHIIPYTVVTNGEDAELLDSISGKVIATGIDAIPDRKTLLEKESSIPVTRLSPDQIEAEKRILSAYDYLEHSLECDDDWCETD